MQSFLVRTVFSDRLLKNQGRNVGIVRAPSSLAVCSHILFLEHSIEHGGKPGLNLVCRYEEIL